jgi:hypothetical protein
MGWLLLDNPEKYQDASRRIPLESSTESILHSAEHKVREKARSDYFLYIYAYKLSVVFNLQIY